MGCCEMRGYLSFLILWILSRGSLNGAGISKELQKRRGTKPSPGTIYPALKDLSDRGLIELDKGRKYALTRKGRKELKSGCSSICRIFYDMEEIADCCKTK